MLINWIEKVLHLTGPVSSRHSLWLKIQWYLIVLDSLLQTLVHGNGLD